MTLLEPGGSSKKPPKGWKPPELPSLDGVDEVELDFETTGLRWWGADEPIGIAIGWNGQQIYAGTGHTGGNIDPEKVKLWMKQELKGKLISGSYIKFDGHMSRKWEVDLEKQGNRLRDIGHVAALIDDHRFEFGLDALGKEYCQEGKDETAKLDKSRMASYAAWEVEDYAKQDVRLPRKILDVLMPQIRKQDLQKTLDLECRTIWPVIEMEKNGAHINEELLDKMIKRSEQDFNRYFMDIHRETGVKLNPKSPQSMMELFNKLKLEPPRDVKTGNPTFRDEYLRRFTHPTVVKARRAKLIRDIRSKALLLYKKEKNSEGLIRYALHQLRGGDEEGGGAVTGRFSSSGFGKDLGGVNIQQIRSVERQRLAFGYDEKDGSHDDEIYLIRQLFVPRDSTKLWLSADARQIEYRLFAHYANSPKILRAYADDPLTDFHNLVLAMIKLVLPSMTRKKAKDINFAKIYGAGLRKIAVMLGFRREGLNWTDPEGLAETQPFVDAYDTAFPEAEKLMKYEMELAEERGYVKTILGRRSRFPYADRLHKALNSVIQGGAADVNKIKLCELHEAREETGMLMCFTVHDEVDGEVQDMEAMRRVEEILNRQSIDFRVPILWDVAAEADWRMCA